MAGRRSRFVRPAPRTKMWIGSGVGDTTVGSATTVLVSTLSAGALLLRPFTILRTRMVLGFRSDQIVTSEHPVGLFGKIVITEAAAAIGITAIPNPSGISGDPEADWFVWQALQASIERASDVGITGGGQQIFVVDSKAMRKVGPDDDVATLCD